MDSIVKTESLASVRQNQDSLLDSSDSSDSSQLTNNNDSGLSLYKSASFKCNNFVNKLDSYNNNQLLLPTQFYKTLLAKAVLSSNDDKANVYKNMLFHKDRDFEQVKVSWMDVGFALCRFLCNLDVILLSNKEF